MMYLKGKRPRTGMPGKRLQSPGSLSNAAITSPERWMLATALILFIWSLEAILQYDASIYGAYREFVPMQIVYSAFSMFGASLPVGKQDDSFA